MYKDRGPNINALKKVLYTPWKIQFMTLAMGYDEPQYQFNIFHLITLNTSKQFFSSFRKNDTQLSSLRRNGFQRVSVISTLS